MQAMAQAQGATNPHALASIMKASESCQIVAQEDILDEHGVKLWGKGQPISRALQQRLLERKLSQPLESCLRAEDGVTHGEMVEVARRLVDTQPLLHSAISPWATDLLSDIPRLPLHPVAQLLLTASRGSSAQTYEHAIQSMLLAGALALHAGGDRYQQRLSMLGGLVHDIGELYIQPDYLRNDLPLGPEAWRSICVHPRVGEMLLQRQTDYPKELCRAVGEHHERGNGLGYPARVRYLSWLGARLSAVETFMGVLASEFDGSAVSFASQAAKRHQSQSRINPCPDSQAVWHAAQELKNGLQSALRESWVLAASSASPKVSGTARMVSTILEQLLRSCDALGLWAPRHLPGEHLHELHLAHQELRFRMQSLRRVSCWLDESWLPQESEELDRLWRVAGASLAKAA
jgi:HD domain